MNLIELEGSGVYVNFLDHFFFMMYSVSLVGYGANLKSDYSIIIICLILPYFFLVVPEIVSEMLKNLSSKSVYAR